MTKKKQTLEVHGKIVGRIRKLTPAQQKAKDFLDNLPLHKVYTSEGLADELLTSLCNLRTWLSRLGEEYRYADGKTYCYGNPETIKLQKEGFYEVQA